MVGDAVTNDILQKLKKVIMEQLDIKDESAIVEGAHIADDLGADSLGAVELIMAMEEEFGISIPDEDAEKILTVGDAINYVKEKADLG